MHGISVATAWKVFLGVVVPLKIAVFGVGYVAWMLAAPSGAKRREALLEHVHSVLTLMQDTGKSSDKEALAELNRELAKLDAKVGAGWKDQDDLASLMRLLKFIGVVHIRETKDAVHGLKESAWGLVIDAIETMLPKEAKPTT